MNKRMNNQAQRHDSLQQMIEEQKQSSFTDTASASDEEALGILLSQHFNWNGLPILRAAYFGLADANFHTEAEQVEQIIASIGARVR